MSTRPRTGSPADARREHATRADVRDGARDPEPALPADVGHARDDPSDREPLSPGRAALRALWIGWTTRASIVVLGAALFVALFAPVFPLASPVKLELARALEGPHAAWTHGFEPEYWELSAVDRALVHVRTEVFGDRQLEGVLGRDSKGRDLLARLVWGSRISFLVALCAGLTSLVLGVGFGAVAGYAGGRVDNLMMRALDALQALPFVFLVIVAITLVSAWKVELEQNLGLSREAILYVLVGAVSWLSMARVVRGQVLMLRRAEFIAAARVMGASSSRILFVHVLPNVLSIVVVYLTLSVPAILLTEAFLSFLGLGIEPPKVSWGLLVADGAEAINPLRVPWWIVVFPAAAMGVTLLALNLLGDGLRDALDPRERGRS